MRNYIITDQEKEIMRRYLDDGIRLEGFTVLKNRVYKAIPEIADDICLLNEFYTTIENDAPPHVREKIRKFHELVKKCALEL